MSATYLNIEVGYQDVEDPSPKARATRWTEDASGHRWWTFVVDVSGLPAQGIEHVAEAVFLADNSTLHNLDHPLADRVRAAMDEVYAKTDDRHHSLSTGDRVRMGETEVICCPIGWKPVRATSSIGRADTGLELEEHSGRQ